MGIRKLSLATMMGTAFAATANAYVIEETSLTINSGIDFVLPQIQFGSTNNPVSLVKDLDVYVTNQADIQGCSLVASDPGAVQDATCLFEWTQLPPEFTSSGFNATGLPMTTGPSSFGYKVSLLTNDIPVELLAATFDVNVGPPLPPSMTGVTSSTSAITTDANTGKILLTHMQSTNKPVFSPVVAVREYDQKVTVIDGANSTVVGECTVPVGEASCSITFLDNISTPETGWKGPYEFSVKSANDLLEGGLVGIENMDIQWDYRPPEPVEVFAYTPNDLASDFKTFTSAFGDITLAKNEAAVILTSPLTPEVAQQVMPTRTSLEFTHISSTTGIPEAKISSTGEPTRVGTAPNDGWLYRFTVGDNLPDGTYNTLAKGADQNGNAFSKELTQISLDRVPPEVNIYFAEREGAYEPVDGQLIFFPEQLVVYANDGKYSSVDITSVSINGTDVSWSKERDDYFRVVSGNAQVSLAESDTMQVDVVVVDEAGNTSHHSQQIQKAQLSYTVTPLRAYQKEFYYRYLSSFQGALKSDNGIVCPLTFSQEDADAFINYTRATYTCLVEYDLPSGVVADKTSVKGTFNVDKAQARIGYRIYAYTNSSKTEIFSGEDFFDLKQPEAPHIQMWGLYADSKVNVSGDEFELQQSGVYQCVSEGGCTQPLEQVKEQLPEPTILLSSLGGRLGNAVVTGTSATMKVELFRGNEKIMEHESLSLGAFRSFLYDRDEMNVFSSVPYRLKASYKALPDVYSEMTWNVLRTPPTNLILRTPRDRTSRLSNESVLIDVNIGAWDPVERDVTFKGKNIYGDWNVYLAERTREGFIPISEPKGINDDGTVQIPVNLEGKDYLSYYAVAELVVTDEKFAKSLRSPHNYFQVIKAGGVDAIANTRTVSGRVPFYFRSNLLYGSRQDRSIASEVEWQVSSDEGSTWTNVEDYSLKPYLNYVFDSVGLYKVRAKMVNRHTQVVSYTPEVDINAFYAPDFRISGNSSVFVNDPMTMRVTIDGQVPAADSVEVQWAFGSGEFTPGGVEAVVQHDVTGRYYAKAKVRYKTSDPNNPASWVTYQYRYSVFNPSPIRLGVQIPREVEIGKTYNLIGRPYGDKNLRQNMKHTWRINQGSEQPGLELSYTPTETDLGEYGRVPVIFATWYEGFKEQTYSEISTSISAWKYQFPEFDMITYQKSLYPPADIRFTAKSRTPLYRVNANYLWDLGVLANQVDDKTTQVITTKVTEPGIYPVTVTITDDRGNQTIVNNFIEIKEPDPYSLDMSLYFSNETKREPLTVRAQTLISGGNPNDFISNISTVIKNSLGDEMASLNRDYVFSQDLPVGSYTAVTEFTTSFGQNERVEQSFDVVENIAPTCSVNETESNSATQFLADCSDPDGKVVRFEWWVNDKLIKISSYPNVAIYNTALEGATVKLVVKDDGGKQTEVQVR